MNLITVLNGFVIYRLHDFLRKLKNYVHVTLSFTLSTDNILVCMGICGPVAMLHPPIGLLKQLGI